MKTNFSFISNFKPFTLCPGKWAVNMYIFSRLLFLAKLYPLAIIIYRASQYITGTDISFRAEIGRDIYIPHPFGIVIGPTSRIGNNVTIMQGVTLGSKKLTATGKRHPDIGDCVMIGANAVILGPILVANHAVIGANTVVTKNVPEHTTVVGRQ